MTTKKRGRGRPKKTEKPIEKSLAMKYLENTRKELGIPTNEVALSNNLKLARTLEAHETTHEGLKTVFEGDFSISIDNETHDRGVRFVKSGDNGLAEIFLADYYLENNDFRLFINSIIIRAARQKTAKLSLELDSLGG